MTKSLILLCGLFVPAACLGEKPIFFLQMSDPQFGMFTDNKGFEHETANFEFAMATANRLRPAFVVVCGDLVNKPGDAAQIAEYLRVSHELDGKIPFYSVAGNHDVGNAPTPESLALYRKNIGMDHYSFRAGEFEGIVLNSSVIQHPENAREEERIQKMWLEDELKKARAAGVKQLAVFQHIPWFLKTPDEPDQYFNIPLETRREYLALLKRYGVRYVFAGHLHENSLGKDGDLTMVTTGPVGKPLGTASSGIRVVTVEGDAMTDKYYGLGNLPHVIPEAK